VRLRDAERRDAAAIRSLQSQLSHPSPALSEAAIDGPFTCRVAVAAGRPVGYAVALSGRPTVLSELVVAAGHRREGYGRALLAAVTRDADRVEATTPAGNDAAIGFYGAQGFAVDERVEAFYADGTDALRLVRGE